MEIRERLAALIGEDARRITVLTCHAMAMRLTGHCFTGKRLALDEESFRDIIRQAAALVRGEGLAPDEADAQRERLLEGYRWILVDEYQDIEAEQYELIAALAGRTRADEDGRLSLFAVGDDDQNIYSFAGASVAYIRRFEEDYTAKPAWLTDNYRSTRHIIDTANRIIEPAHNRMKERHPIRIDRRREADPPGAVLAKLDPVAAQPDGIHWAVLRDALEDYALETGGTEQPRERFIEWLVEWCRDARRRQRGLLLVTAHSAKGLQFDHVGVLDGDWMRYGKGEDPDAPRRLYYVAMTRARQSLLLARGHGRDGDLRGGSRRGNVRRHLLDELQPGPAVVFREAVEVGEVAPELRRVRRRLGQGLVDLGFAGRYGQSRPVHADIAGLATGDGLTLRDEDGRWELHDAAGNLVGRLAKAFAMPAGMRCIEASVAAVIVRSGEDSPPEYREQVRCARWEVVMPELLLEPVQGAVDYERRRGVSRAVHGERWVADR